MQLAALAAEPVVGFDLHTLSDDLGLQTWSAGWIDLLDLAGLVLPGSSARSEAALRAALALSPPPHHQDALTLARSGAEVFLALIAVIDALDLETLMHVNRLAATLDWPYRRLFAEAEQRQVHRVFPAATDNARNPLGALAAGVRDGAHEHQRLVPNRELRRLHPERLAETLAGGGTFARSLHGFEERAEQQAMVHRIAETFNEGGRLLVETGTGTGKSLAYLVPAAHFAVANNRRVVVSTNTINLQDQLLQKDLPEVGSATGLPLRVSILKGRTNYLCLTRWYGLLRSDQLEPHERSMLIKTLLWVQRTETGDRAELRLTGREEEAWARVSASDACTPLRCQFHRAGVCFLARARRVAEASHLVVVNHALLLADAVSKNTVLPQYEHLVVDEAHHLEREATAQFGWSTSHRELLSRLSLFFNPTSALPSGLIRETLRWLGQPGHALDGAPSGRSERFGRASENRRQSQAASALEQQLLVAVQRTREGLDHVFALLRRFLEQAGHRAEAQVALRLSGSTRAQPFWSEVEVAWDEAAGRIGRLESLLSQLLEQVEQSVSGDTEPWETILADLVGQLTYWHETAENLAGVLVERRPDLIPWLSRGRTDDLFVNAAPLHVGPLLEEWLFGSRSVVILTSATLSTDGHCRYVKERLSLEEADELLLGAPFDYQRAALVYLPTDMPEPTQPGYQERVQEAVLALATALGGRCLVLFTSYAQLRSTYQTLREAAASAGIRLLAQAQDGASRASLLEAFKAGQRSVLLGTSSFWEGVDVVGEALSCVVMPRLPFSVPSDPVFEARSEAFDDPFRQYALPQAILRFKQGFGRLIRSRGDRGAVILLDRRLDTKFYGRSFLRSLPGCTLTRGPLEQTAPVVRQWLASSPMLSDVPFTLPSDAHGSTLEAGPQTR